MKSAFDGHAGDGATDDHLIKIDAISFTHSYKSKTER